MNFSFWETDTWFKKTDFTIIGSGIVGLNCAWNLKKRFPNANVLILERGMLPHGASTRNGGFATFGSLSEIIADLGNHTPEEVVALVKKRREGLSLLRKNLGDEAIDYREYGGTELFVPSQEGLLEKCRQKREQVNELLYPVFQAPAFLECQNIYGFQNVLPTLFHTPFEGQIHTGKMMSTLLQKVLATGVKILNQVTVTEYDETASGVHIKTDKFELTTSRLIIATNGFSAQLNIPQVKPARSQILVTEPIENLHLKGAFHLDEGFYYFRNIGNRLLIGGGRNLDIQGEETTSMEYTDLIQNNLERLLRESILPQTPWKVEQRWSGIMGVGDQKKPIVKQLSDRTFCGVRLGGMGVAIGSKLGEELADLAMA